MNNNQWITDRLPTEADADYAGWVWMCLDKGRVHRGMYTHVTSGVAWMPITPPEPYVKPKRYRIDHNWSGYTVYDTVTQELFADHIYSQDAAERIAAIYEEARP